VGFVNLLKRHDKPWMDGRVRRVNLWLGPAMTGRGMAHTVIIDVPYVMRDDYMTHGLHLNSLGREEVDTSNCFKHNWRTSVKC
jgi:hypothetical protein